MSLAAKPCSRVSKMRTQLKRQANSLGFFDTHAHLHFEDYDQDRDTVIARLRESGIESFINVGTTVESSRKSLEYAEKYDFVYASAGIHPNECKDTTPAELQEITELLNHPRMVGIGEIGLDYYRDHAPKERQKEVLDYFLKLHQKIEKPLIIHCREAYDDLAGILKSMSKTWRGVMHCFSSDTAAMEKFLGLGFYISFAGPLTYKKDDTLREACKNCPPDRLLLETDAPFLPPQSMRGKRNEPALMIETARTAAELHGLSLEDLGRKTTANARALFRL